MYMKLQLEMWKINDHHKVEAKYSIQYKVQHMLTFIICKCTVPYHYLEYCANYSQHTFVNTQPSILHQSYLYYVHPDKCKRSDESVKEILQDLNQTNHFNKKSFS